jgi:hypothetical protein
MLLKMTCSKQPQVPIHVLFLMTKHGQTSAYLHPYHSETNWSVTIMRKKSVYLSVSDSSLYIVSILTDGKFKQIYPMKIIHGFFTVLSIKRL